MQSTHELFGAFPAVPPTSGAMMASMSRNCPFQSQCLDSFRMSQALKAHECSIPSDEGQRMMGIRFSAIISWCQVSRSACVKVSTRKPSCSLAGHERTAFLPFIVRLEKLRLDASPSMLYTSPYYVCLTNKDAT